MDKRTQTNTKREEYNIIKYGRKKNSENRLRLGQQRLNPKKETTAVAADAVVCA